MVWAFLSDFSVALLGGANLGSSQLLTIDARTQEIAQELFVSCEGDASLYNALSHELRVDAEGGEGSSRLVTTAYVVKSYPEGVAVDYAVAPLNESTWSTEVGPAEGGIIVFGETTTAACDTIMWRDSAVRAAHGTAPARGARTARTAVNCKRARETEVDRDGDR